MKHCSLLLVFLAAILSPRLSAQVPPVINYQGRVGVNEVNFDGVGQFKFSLVNGTGNTTYWSNDGSGVGGSPPSAYVNLPVSKGNYSVLIGDATLQNMSVLPPSIFENNDLYLRIWFNDGVNGFQQLIPDRRLASVGYSMIAHNVPNGSITGAKIAPAAISAEQIRNNSITGEKVVNAGVTGEKIASNSVTTEKLTIGAVTADKLAVAAVTTDKIASNAITSDKLMNGSVTSDKLALGAINNAQLASSSITWIAGVGLSGGGTIPLGGTLTLSNTGVISIVGGGGITVSAANGAVTLGSSATSLNSGGAIIARDSSGGFSAGLVNLPATSASNVGLLTQNGARLLHSYGADNLFVGRLAGNFSTTGSQITALGVATLSADESGSANTAIGYQAMETNISGSDNTAVGRRALSSNTRGSNNVAIGRDAGANLTTGSNNVHIANAGVEGESGTIRIGVPGTHANTYIAGVLHGDASGLTNISSASITPESVGSSKIINNSILNEDVNDSAGISYAKLNLTAGIKNTDIAPSAAISDTKLATISAVGKVANSATTATSLRVANSIVLRDANGSFNAGSFTTDGAISIPATNAAGAGTINQNGIRLLHSFGTSNFFAGRGAGNFVLAGTHNTGVGTSALTDLQGGSENTGLGSQALSNNDSGEANVAIGSFAARLNTSGSQNTSVGTAAAQRNRSGGLNTSAGAYAAEMNTTGSSNVSVGHSAGRLLDGGSNNTALGTNALSANLTGSGNIAVGSGAGANVTSTSNNIHIGNTGIATDVGAIRIGTQGIHNAVYLSGVITGNGSGLFGIPLSGLATDAVDTTKVVNGSLVNEDFSDEAKISDTKLANINTVGKVANSATTGTSSNSPQTLVLRDANGDFSAGKVSASTFAGVGSGLTAVPGAVPWNVVIEKAQLTQGNQGYVLTHPEEVSVTLPAAPAVGDIVRVSGAGMGGWRILPSGVQRVISVNLQSPPGQFWTGHETTRVWSSIASSSNGSTVAATVAGGQIYVSSDYGQTWIAREGNRMWRDLTMSADGTRLAAVAEGGRIYVSDDSGATWSARENNRNWQAITTDEDGSVFIAVVSGGLIYRSTDSGVNWTAVGTSRTWISVAASSDGSKLVAAVQNGFLYTSIDSGVTWNQCASSSNWKDVTSSTDGRRLAAVADGSLIHVSTDSGVTWTPQDFARKWKCISSSGTGDTLVAGVEGGQLYLSYDAGLTWSPRESDRLWSGVSSSVDGTRLFVAGEVSQLYSSELAKGPPLTSVATGQLRGLYGAAVELQYIGDHRYLPLSLIGTIIAY